MNTLRQIIEQYLPSNARTNHKGWCPVLCKICNDHGKKGPRAGFRWTNDIVGYNCFNCTHSAKFDPSVDTNMSKNMVTVLRAYGIPDTDWLGLINPNAQKTKNNNEQSLIPKSIQLPTYFYPLTDDGSIWCDYAINYLKERNINWQDQPFYLADKSNKFWYGRIIIPMYHQGNLVSYIGRDLTDKHKSKYKTAEDGDPGTMYGYDNILAHSSEPIFVCEGWFDAFPLKGVAVFKHKLSDVQIKWLNRTSRKKVIIPDQFGDGKKLAMQALSLGWDVSFPFINSDVNDINSGIAKYGLFWVLKAIKDNTKSGFDAELNIQLYCK